MIAHDIIIRPILSEKSYADIQNKKYTFEVDKNSTKTQIKAAVEEIFKVKVLSVNTANKIGKIKFCIFRIYTVFLRLFFYKFFICFKYPFTTIYTTNFFIW